MLRVAAIRRERPSEQALLLRSVRPIVPIVAGGFVLTIGAGFWLVGRLDLDLGATWLSATFALILWLLVVGALAGRADRRTRELAEELAADGDRPTPELTATPPRPARARPRRVDAARDPGDRRVDGLEAR